jgi:hypothetical protein
MARFVGAHKLSRRHFIALGAGSFLAACQRSARAPGFGMPSVSPPTSSAPDSRTALPTHPWVEIFYQDASTSIYLGSPSLVRLEGGALLACHDYFGPAAPQSFQGRPHLTSVYHSSDDGQTWQNVSHIYGAFWSNLFTHRGAVYLFGISQEYGSIVIRRSGDGGSTWTHPTDERSGLLFPGGPGTQPPNYHCAPMPVLLKDGRLYRAFEDCDPCGWGKGFQSFVLSAPEDADLLVSTNWRMSNKLPYDPAWTPRVWGNPSNPGWLEGNVVEAPNGDLWNILRFNSTPVVDKAAVVAIYDEGRFVDFDPTSGFIDFPGGMAKFAIRREASTGLYLTLSNNNTDSRYPSQRNVLSLHASNDLLRWQHKKTLLTDDSGLAHESSMQLTGFQYVDWQFDGDDIIYIVRMAYRGAHNYHDANRITFHRLKDFRKLL